MEKKLNFKEAFTYMFQKEENLHNFAWYMIISLIPLLPVALTIGIILANGASSFNSTAAIDAVIGVVVSIFVSILLGIFCSFLRSGFLATYMHNKALDENATLPSFNGNIINFLWLGFRSGVGNFLSTLAIEICCLVISLPLAIIFIIGVIVAVAFGHFVSETLAVVTYGITVFLVLLPILFLLVWWELKVIANFIIDLKLTSYLKWKRVLEVTNSVPGLIPVVFTAFGAILFFGIFLAIAEMGTYMHCLPLTIIFGIIAIVYGFYMTFVTVNLYAQWIGKCIDIKLGGAENYEQELETKSKSIIVASVLAVLSIMFFAAMNTLSFMVTTAQFPVDNAIQRYEHTIKNYLWRNDITGLPEDVPCEDIASQITGLKAVDKCDYVDKNGIEWIFEDGTGNVTLHIKQLNVDKTIEMGVCKDGSVNCKEEFPDVNYLRHPNKYSGDYSQRYHY